MTLDLLLGHQPSQLSPVARIYQKEKHLDVRRAALEAWGEHLTAAPAEVVTLPAQDPPRKAAGRDARKAEALTLPRGLSCLAKRADAPPPWWLEPLAWRLAETMEIAQSDGRPKDARHAGAHQFLASRRDRQAHALHADSAQRACRTSPIADTLRPPQVGLINGLPPFEAVAPFDRPPGSPSLCLKRCRASDALTWSLTDAAAARQAADREAPPDQRGCASDRDGAVRRTLADADCASAARTISTTPATWSASSASGSGPTKAFATNGKFTPRKFTPRASRERFSERPSNFTERRASRSRARSRGWSPARRRSPSKK